MDVEDASARVLALIDAGREPKRIMCKQCREGKERKPENEEYKAKAKESRKELFALIEADKAALRCSVCTGQCNPRYHKVWNCKKLQFVYKHSLGTTRDVYHNDCEIVCMKELYSGNAT